MLVFGGIEVNGCLLVANLLPLCSMSTGRSKTSKEYGFLQYIEVTHQIDTVEDILEYVCLR